MAERVELPPAAPRRRRADTPGARAQRARVVAALGEHRCIPIAKDDVIGYLAVADWTPAQREDLYRAWCEVVGLDVTRGDLARARQGKRREANRRLEFGVSDAD